MRCESKSKKYGRCVLDTHLGERHMNGQGMRWEARRDGSRRSGGTFAIWLPAAMGKELQAIAKEIGTSPGGVIKTLVVEYLQEVGKE